MKILFYGKTDSETYDEDDDNALVLKDNYKELILFIKVIIAMGYSFGLGYNLYHYSEEIYILKNFFIALRSLITFYLILEYIYIFFNSILLPKALNNNVIVNLKLFKSSNSTKDNVNKGRLILSLLLPFFLFSLVPTFIGLAYGFNPVLYSFLYASAVKGTSYIIYAIIIILKDFDKEILVKDDAYIKV